MDLSVFAATVVIFAMFYVQPIWTMLWTSFTKWDGFNDPTFNGVSNYVRVFTNSAAAISLKNLLYWSIIAMTLHVGFGVLVAFVLYHHPKGWKFTRAVFMIPNVISAAAWALIYRLFLMIMSACSTAQSARFFPTSTFSGFTPRGRILGGHFTWLFYAVIVTLVVLQT